MLKSECATLFKPWLDLKGQITRFKKRLDEIKDKVPEEQWNKLEDRVSKFNAKYHQISKIKDQLRMFDLQNLHEDVPRYKEKVLVLAKNLVQTYD